MNIATEEWIGKRILGAWQLVSWVFENEEGKKVKYFGNAPKGMLMYLESGYMSVQIAQESRTEFNSPSIDSGTKEEMASAFATFLSYYGKYEEKEPGVFAHYVKGTLFPNWLKKQEIRYANIQDKTLILSTPPIPTQNGDIVFKITWEKVTQ